MASLRPARRIGPLKPFACSYESEGARFAITLYATSWGMAEAAVACLRRGRVDGLMIGEVDA